MKDCRNAIQLVTYQPDYAQSIADMWNLSNDSWGGSTSIRTAEQVRQQEASSDSIIVFLALDHQQVVGYCSICEYRDENGALYVQLLNVSPDYHGQGVGKQLMLHAVEETMKRGWKRLDLHTWGANLKAVPLYKRCGFFWEERDDQVHLMNFIPQLVSYEALAPYMARFDWYRDSIREIKIEPDVQVDNGFHTYSYKWKNENHALQIDIERRGRGICLIETDDYRLSAHAEAADPVFGQTNSIQYRITNKSGAPLQLSFNGVNDQNIRFEWQAQVDVHQEEVLTASYYVDSLEQEPNEYRTCPTVCADVTINGLAVQLKVGLLTRYPAKLTMNTIEQPYALKGKYHFYIDIENQYPIAATFTFQLPCYPWIVLDRDQLSIRLEARERASIPVPFHLLEYGMYTPCLTIEAAADQGEVIQFERQIGGGFGGPGALAVGQHDKEIVAINGNIRMSMSKDSNAMRIYTLGRDHEGCMLLFPRIGTPYGSELSKKRAERVQLLEQKGAVGFKLTYRSDEFRPLLLHTNALLYADGTVKLWQELYNDSEEGYEKQVCVSQRIHMPLYRAALPYEGRIVEMAASHGNAFDEWDSDLLTEPWIFTRNEQSSVGVTWSEQHRMMFGNWYMDIQYPFESINAHETVTTEPILMSIGGFRDSESFRKIALKSTEPSPIKLISDVEWTINDGNPFLSEDAESIVVTLRDLKKNANKGMITAANTTSSQTCEIESDQPRTEVNLTLSCSEKAMDIVHTHAVLGPRMEERTTALFRTSGNISCIEQSVEGNTVYEVNNGMASFKVAPHYFNGLCSLKVNDQEWLDSNYPNYSAKSWYNPWIGGLYSQVSNLQPHHLLGEQRTAAFTTLTDQLGNCWSGIRVTQEIKTHTQFKGVRWDNYFLTMPGVPVVAYVTDVHQDMGWYLGVERNMNSNLFLQSKAGQDHGWLHTSAIDGQPIRYRLGHGDMQILEHKGYVISRDSEPMQMHVVTDEDQLNLALLSNKDLSCVVLRQRLEVPSGSVLRTQPLFLVFSEDTLPYEALQSIRELTFPQYR